MHTGYPGRLLDLAVLLSLFSSDRVGQLVLISREAIRKRINDRFVKVVKQLLCNCIFQHFGEERSSVDTQLFAAFGQVITQDSTTFSLPETMKETFPGNYSRGEKKSVARLDLIIDLKSFSSKEIQLKSYSEMDVTAAGNIMPHLKSGDLVLRDMGYFSLNSLAQIAGVGCYFLSRLRFGIACYEPSGKKKLDLVRVLCTLRTSTTDMNILLGAKKRLPCRLVAVKLPPEVAAERIRKAKKDRRSSANHSKTYYKLLEWAIYITNVPSEIWTAAQVPHAYQSRWQIETIFKAWKSNLNLRNIKNPWLKSHHTIEAIIYCAMIFVVSTLNPIYRKIKKKARGSVSILKIARILKVASSIQGNLCEQSQLEFILQYLGSFEKRKKRKNSFQKFAMPFNPCLS